MRGAQEISLIELDEETEEEEEMRTKDNIWMTRREICGSFRRTVLESKRKSDRKAKIQILADLNHCLPRHIVDILVEDESIPLDAIPEVRKWRGDFQKHSTTRKNGSRSGRTA